MAAAERFIISTGRAGSTLLSRMLSENRGTLVLSEFLGGADNLDRFPTDPVTGERLASILGRWDNMGALMRRRAFGLKEILYSGGEKQGRWGDGSKMPTMLSAPLPYLEPDNPEGLFDDMIAWAKQQPTRSIADQYRALFQWLCQRYSKSVWIERAGSSLRYYDEMRRNFPNAKYVHIHRDGISAALSMREHNWFILAAEYDERPPTTEQIRKAIQEPSMGDDDPVTRLFGKDKPPLEVFARMWTRQIARGFREFVQLNADQYLSVSFEELQAHPERELTRIAEFFEMPADAGWEKRAAAKLDSTLGHRPHNLATDEYERVHAAVLPGQILLGREDPAQLNAAYRIMRDAFEQYDPD